jgi:UDP-N-acetylmuramoyl-L-alanyl-D-glutamate--2,6-diaminopimelate ligase
VGFSLSEALVGDPRAAALGPVGGVNADSRKIGLGEVFFALPGTTAHGNQFVAAAVDRGAIAVVTDTPLAADPGVPVLVVADVRAAYARAAAAAYAPQPDIAVAVTGTNGKTSVTSFVRQIWEASGRPAASLGTLGVETSEGLAPGSLTTPDPLTLHRDLGDLRARGRNHVSLEASSHGLDQRRLDGLAFDAVGFTNLTRDHLDYHGTLDAYRAAKLRLFTHLLKPGGAAVFNDDDPKHMPFVTAARDRGATLLTVGREGAWFEVGAIVNDGFGQRVTGRLMGEAVSFRLPLTGAFQVSNALVALGLAVSTGVPADIGLRALERLKGARGRLDLVADRDGAAVFVDYAHTPDALEKALQSLRPYATGRLTVVFGCGGDRDRGKRPIMGGIATRLADRAIVTDDNPRTEDAAAIRAEVMTGTTGAEEIGDRASAIRAAVKDLRRGDVVLIAGKGHEDYQILGTTKVHFDDREEAARALGARGL